MIALRLASAMWTATFWLALGIVMGLAAATTAPALLEYRTFNVLTSSMEPSIPVGSVVVDEPIKPAEARPGQVITFPDPGNNSRLFTHRVQRVSFRAGRVYMVTRGDANDAVERWNVPAREEIGRVVYMAPKLGYLRQWAAGRGGQLAALTAVVLWGLSALRDIWRDEEEPAEEAAAGAAPG